MFVAYGTLIPTFLVILWAFFHYSPKAGPVEKVRIYNILSMFAAVGSSGGYVWYLRSSMLGGSD